MPLPVPATETKQRKSQSPFSKARGMFAKTSNNHFLSEKESEYTGNEDWFTKAITNDEDFQYIITGDSSSAPPAAAATSVYDIDVSGESAVTRPETKNKIAQKQYPKKRIEEKVGSAESDDEFVMTSSSRGAPKHDTTPPANHDGNIMPMPQNTIQYSSNQAPPFELNKISSASSSVYWGSFQRPTTTCHHRLSSSSRDITRGQISKTKEVTK